MKDFFKKTLSEEDWLIKEEEWIRHLQGSREAQFSLGNGYIASRGILEELPYDAYAGTYLAGVYDKAGAQVTELVNLPNPVNFKIVADGEKLDVVSMDVLKHERILDLKKAILKRRTLYINSRKERFDYQSLRFFSKENVHIGAMQVYFTALDNDIDIVVETSIDTSVTNKGCLTEGRKRHFEITKFSVSKDITYLCVETYESKILVGYGSYLEVKKDKTPFAISREVVHLKVKKNTPLCFTKIFSIFSSREIKAKNLESYTLKTLSKAINAGFRKLLNQHIRCWKKIWFFSDVYLQPDKNLTKALRFNIYHMLICANEKDEYVSIPARTLSGEGYRGHIFWDTEIFVLPFFIYTNPSVARNILYYRYHTLEEAKKRARQRNLRGAFFAWESADKGEDTTPPFHKDLNGRIIKILTGELEQHIVADIAYAVYHYYLASKDKDFMRKVGFELIFETARFWASKVKYNKITNSYHIEHVIGPDEFHVDINDNAYTNSLARWNLLIAHRLYNLEKAHPSDWFNNLTKRLNLSDKEALSWLDIGKKIYIPEKKSRGLIEAFRGYFRKKDILIQRLDNNFMPIMPEGVSSTNLAQTQLIKQADTVLLLYLLSNNFTLKQKKDNFLYYDKRTLHKSSLSPSISAIVGWEIGEFSKAYRYFLYSLYADLKNLHGNTSDGIHAASLGGSWQVVINGFVGMRVEEDTLCFRPKLPRNISSIKFKIHYQDWIVDICARKDTLQIFPRGKKGYVKIKLFEEKHLVPNNRKTSLNFKKFKKEAC